MEYLIIYSSGAHRVTDSFDVVLRMLFDEAHDIVTVVWLTATDNGEVKMQVARARELRDAILSAANSQNLWVITVK